jgi:hypothetical protein
VLLSGGIIFVLTTDKAMLQWPNFSAKNAGIDHEDRAKDGPAWGFCLFMLNDEKLI